MRKWSLGVLGVGIATPCSPLSRRAPPTKVKGQEKFRENLLGGMEVSRQRAIVEHLRQRVGQVRAQHLPAHALLLALTSLGASREWGIR